MNRLHNAVLLTLLLTGVHLHAEEQLPQGVVQTRPAAGPMVKIDSGWMVPYRQRIPGTDFTFRMIPVPRGMFLMGSPPEEEGRQADEGPQVLVNVDPMWVGQAEVTRREYGQYQQLYTVFKEVARNHPAYKDLDRSRVDVVTAPTDVYDPFHLFEYGDDPTHPAVAMTRYAAKQYTKWLSVVTKRQYRLPTEAEWEYACRAGSTTRFSWGDPESVADKYASYFDNAEMLSHPGGKLPNDFELFDMHGNVGEWTVDAYTPNGYGHLKKNEPVNAIKSTKWPTTATAGVVRGGSIESSPDELRSGARLASDEEGWKNEDANFPKSPWWFTSDPSRTIGFRVFRSAKPLDPETISKFWNHTSDDVGEDVEAKLAGGRGAVGIVDEDDVNKLRQKRRSK